MCVRRRVRPPEEDDDDQAAATTTTITGRPPALPQSARRAPVCSSHASTLSYLARPPCTVCPRPALLPRATKNVAVRLLLSTIENDVVPVPCIRQFEPWPAAETEISPASLLATLQPPGCFRIAGGLCPRRIWKTFAMRLSTSKYWYVLLLLISLHRQPGPRWMPNPQGPVEIACLVGLDKLGGDQTPCLVDRCRSSRSDACSSVWGFGM